MQHVNESDHATPAAPAAPNGASAALFAIYLTAFAGASAAPGPVLELRPRAALPPGVSRDEAQVAAAIAEDDARSGRPPTTLGALVVEVIRILDDRRRSLARPTVAAALRLVPGGAR